MHDQAIYIHQVVCDRGWQTLGFSEIFVLEAGIGLRQMFDYKLKLVSTFSIVTRFYSMIYLCL